MVLCPKCKQVLDKVIYERVVEVEYDLDKGEVTEESVVNEKAYCAHCDEWIPLWYTSEHVLFAKCPWCGSVELELYGPVKDQVKLECRTCGRHFWVRL